MPDRQAAWTAIDKCHEALGDASIMSLFESDASRAQAFSAQAAGLFLDYSKNRISNETKDALIALARASGVELRRDDMFRGERINFTEDRAVLHTALRDRSGRVVPAGDDDACEMAGRERVRMFGFADAIIDGSKTGTTDKPLTTVVNIGIGGSDLGPLMAVEALRPYWIEGRRCFFVSNVDGQHLSDTLAQCDPETTLFVIASKTFTTQETMTNARSALDWFKEHLGADAEVDKHFVALSTNHSAVAEFGISPDCTFGFWDWVGGRYSMWSSIGLSVALQVGTTNFLSMLDGAHVMDEHFRYEPLPTNMPVMLALVGIWNRNFEDIGVHAVLPYDQHLHRLPAYLQQADMESNGKAITRAGTQAAMRTGPVIFGEPGTNGQHAFYQLLHQGTEKISADFLAPAKVKGEIGDHHLKLLANVLAQPRALMCGKDAEQVRSELLDSALSEEQREALVPHKVFDGDRPSNVILYRELTPEVLGALVALYEHKIFCQGVIWDINSFDQWGVELGKQLANEILPMLSAQGSAADVSASDLDGSTAQLLDWLKSARATD